MNIIEDLLPKGAKTNNPNRIIIHAMGEFIRDDDGQVYSAVDWLRKLGLSAHAFGLSNGTIIRGRKDNQGAYHAKGHNTDTLSYEFLVKGIHDYSSFKETIKKPYLPDKEYKSGVDFIKSEWVDGKGILHLQRHSKGENSERIYDF